MFRHRLVSSVACLGLLLAAGDVALAQRGGRGGMRGGGGFSGGGMRGGGGFGGGGYGGMTRPSMPMNRPATPQSRPNVGGMTRPNLGGGSGPGASTRPNIPNLGGGSGPGASTRPNIPNLGGGNRPGGGSGPGASTRPNIPNLGGGGNGGGSRPPWGNISGNFPNRPGGGIGGNYPNRPGDGGIGNRPDWSGVNRPGWGGGRPNWNNVVNDNANRINNITHINNVNRTNVVNNNWWGGGGRGPGWGGGWGSPGWGGGWGPGAWGGDWWRGGWGGNGFWTGFGTGALTAFGVGAMTSWFRPAYVGVQTMPVYQYFPTWSVGAYDTWGLGTVASQSIYSGYANPYAATVVAAQQPVVVDQPAQVFDYSQPIDVAAPAPAPEVAQTGEQIFASARDAFKTGDYGQALSLIDEVVKQTPDVPVVHEFRGLCLFALGRYDDAASVLYAVLSAGPGWNWETLVGLYPGVETYTTQLRALEDVVKTKPDDPAPYFLLAYHYMVQGHKSAAAAQFQEVVKRAPGDTLSASFVKALGDADAVAKARATADAAPPAVVGPETEPKAEVDHPPPPPANLTGKWTAKPADDLTITLNLEQDGVFTWEVDSKGQKQTLTGMAGYKDDVLGLFQEDGPPLSGKVSDVGPASFTFSPAEGGKGPSLTFTR